MEGWIFQKTIVVLGLVRYKLMMVRIVENFENTYLPCQFFFKNSQSTLVSLFSIVPNCDFFFLLKVNAKKYI